MIEILLHSLGGVIELKATTSVTLDGKLLALGNTGYGPRAGGGAGGSVLIQTGGFYGSGSIDVTGGSFGTEADIVSGELIRSMIKSMCVSGDMKF